MNKNELRTIIDKMFRADTPFKDAVALFKERYLQKALETHRGDSSRAAKALGIDRSSFRRKIKKYKLTFKGETKASGKQKSRKKKRKEKKKTFVFFRDQRLKPKSKKTANTTKSV